MCDWVLKRELECLGMEGVATDRTRAYRLSDSLEPRWPQLPLSDSDSADTSPSVDAADLGKGRLLAGDRAAKLTMKDLEEPGLSAHCEEATSTELFNLPRWPDHPSAKERATEECFKCDFGGVIKVGKQLMSGR
jgi:hypothetical protein